MVFRLPNYWSNWKLEMLVLRRGENRSTRKKTSLSKGENQFNNKQTHIILASRPGI